jgi:tRNA threonylcarbamoyladenosine biosynthesis protein TsaB
VTISGGWTAPRSDRRPLTLLAIETAGSACSAAVARGGAVLAAERLVLRHGHAEVLFPMIERVMQEAGLAPAQLDAVAAAIGPGGFTGIRVGLAAAHGIALAVGARLVGISSFAAVAARVTGPRIGAPDDTGCPGSGGQASGCRALLVALDSRRADLYVQLFALDGAAPLAVPQALIADRLGEYVARLAGDATLLIAGDAAEAASAALGGRAGIAIAGNSAPDAEGVFAAALHQLGLDDAADAPAGPVRPLYLRPPDVTPPSRPPPSRPPAKRPRPLPVAAR